MEELSANFRPIHYLGSKLRLLNFIQETINQLDSTKGVVCDLFAGSGVVSKHLSLTRPVISNDIQEYSKVISSALLFPFKKVELESLQILESKIYKDSFYLFEPLISYEQHALNELEKGNMNKISEIMNRGPLINYEVANTTIINQDFKVALDKTNKRLINSNLIDSKKTMVTRYYGGLYFSFLQAVIIDTLLEIKDELPEKSKALFHAAILSSASDIVNTIGKQFAQPLNPIDSKGKQKLNLASKILADRRLDALVIFEKWMNIYNNQKESSFNNSVLKLNYEDVLNKELKIKVVYADPPYTRYHYSRYYHVLESISLRDNPDITTIKKNGSEIISKGVYRNDRHQSPFGLKSGSDHSFDTLFRKTSEINASLVLSYSPYDDKSNATPRIQTIDNIIKLAHKYFTTVDVLSFGQFSHSKLNKTKLHIDASDNAEMLIVCKNKEK